MLVAEAKKILLVDDEPKIVEVLERYLTDEGFIVSKAHDGGQAVETFTSQRPDLVILDLKLPEMSGLDVFRLMRAEADTPILMLTSRTDEIDRIIGLELGADDYITKPFSPREVVARVKTVLRRSGNSQPRQAHESGLTSAGQPKAPLLVIGDLRIDPENHEVWIGGQEISLTPTEFRILEALATRPGRTFTRSQLLDATRADDLEVFDRTLDRHIANLRHKVEVEPANPKYVLTVFGVGYKMAKNPQA